MFQWTAFFVPLVHIENHIWTLIGVPLVAGLGYKYIKSKIDDRSSTLPNNDHIKFIKDFDKSSTWNINELSKRAIVIVKSFGFNMFQMLTPRICRMQYRSLYWWGRTDQGNKEAYSLNLEFVKGLIALGLIGGVAWSGLIDKGVVLFVFLGILQWSCIVPVFQYNTDRYMSVVLPFVMFFVNYLSFMYLGAYWFCVPLVLGAWYLAHLLLSLRQYRSIEDMFDFHLFYDPDLPNMRLIQARELMKIDNFEANVRAMILIRDGIIRHKCIDFNSLIYGAKISHKFGNFDEALVLADMALNNPFVGREQQTKSDVEDFKAMVEKDRLRIANEQTESRQVRRAKEREKRKK
jgi:hypothetical protein